MYEDESTIGDHTLADNDIIYFVHKPCMARAVACRAVFVMPHLRGCVAFLFLFVQRAAVILSPLQSFRLTPVKERGRVTQRRSSPNTETRSFCFHFDQSMVRGTCIL